MPVVVGELETAGLEVVREEFVVEAGPVVGKLELLELPVGVEGFQVPMVLVALVVLMELAVLEVRLEFVELQALAVPSELEVSFVLLEPLGLRAPEEPLVLVEP